MDKNIKMNKLPVYELVLGDEEHGEGVHAISFVEEPAFEVDYMFFNKEKPVEFKFITENDKRICVGPSMIPNQKIYRNTNGTEFEVFFSEDTIIKCQELFFKGNHHQGTNINHTSEIINGAVCVESWISTDKDKDKSVALGYDLPVGTWFTSWKIDDDVLWNKVKEGGGFSIEGYFLPEITKMSADIDTIGNIERTLKRDLSTDEMYDIIKKMVVK